jgi:predicted lactoylglutathione lyase
MLRSDPAAWDWSRPVFDHVHLRVADLQASRAFICFIAPSREAVDAFHAAGLAAGGRDNGPPGPRPYGPYSAYVLDPDGTNVEAAHRVWPTP